MEIIISGNIGEWICSVSGYASGECCYSSQCEDLFTVSVFLMIMTSFYFSIGGMLSLVLYGLHRYFEQREGNRVTVRSFLRDGLCFVRSMILAVLMSGFFLVPTALALTGGRSKEQNTSFASCPLLLIKLILFYLLF